MIRITGMVLGAAMLFAPAAFAHSPYGYQGGYAPAYRSYSPPVYSSPVPAHRSYVAPRHRGHATPRYRGGYRHYGYGARYDAAPSYYYYPQVSNPYYTRPRNPHTPRSLGPVSKVPTTEGFNIGYSGGPTYGTDDNPVINGVRLNGAPD